MSAVSPFLRSGPRSKAMAAWVLGALMAPSCIYSILYADLFVFRLIGYALLGMLAEGLFMLALHRRIKPDGLGSAVTAALLAASVPPDMPFLPMLYAILIAVWIVRMPNRNRALRLNAAMAGRLFLMLLFPAQIVDWGTPSADVISTATPQELYRSEGWMMDWPKLLFGRIEGSWEGLFGMVPGSPGETFPLLLLLAGLILCWKHVVAWRAPTAYLFSFMAGTLICGNAPLFNLFSAATVFTAVFIVSDPVSSPMSKGGQTVFGILVGVSNVLIRQYTYYTEAVVFAVLIGNLAVPLLDRAAFSLRGRILKHRI